MTGPPSVVITGMGMVTPLGKSGDSVVESMRSQTTAVRPVQLPAGMSLLMGQVPEADCKRHGGDMALDFAQLAAADAWQTAGLAERNPYDNQRTATIVGSSKGRIGNLFGPGAAGDILNLNPDNFTGDTIGLEVARRFQFSGPVLNYSAACATGVACIVRGIQSLQSGESDVALAGSAESSGVTLLMAGFKNMGALSESPMLPFDVRRCGFNPGEGAATFVLERESDARCRGAAIIARVAGWDQRSDAYHITSADPDGKTVAYAIRRTLERAAWSPADVDYVNAHGTGTQLNDLVEGRAINLAFADSCPLVSGIKPYIGHLLGASSAVELALALSSVRTGYIPATPGLTFPDPAVSLNHVPPLGLNQLARRILKLSLGFGGHIGIVALEVL